jgi:hypothetical protein
LREKAKYETPWLAMSLEDPFSRREKKKRGKNRRGSRGRDCKKRTAAEREELMSPFCSKGHQKFATVELL